MQIETLIDAVREKKQLSHKEVHVWKIPLNFNQAQINNFNNYLDETEKRKAEGYFFRKDRNTYIISHAVLRIILAGYLDAMPSAIRYRTNAYGKPAVRIPDNNHLRFNLSHSREIAVFAFSVSKRVGVDVEYINPGFLDFEIARKYFSSIECRQLFQLPRNQIRKGFFNCWTRKEAYIKAVGKGLSILLNSFQVSLAPGVPVLLCENKKTTNINWTLQEIDIHPDYAAALCVEGTNHRVHLFAL